MTCDSIFISCPQQANPQKQKVDSRDERSGLLIFFFCIDGNSIPHPCKACATQWKD